MRRIGSMLGAGLATSGAVAAPLALAISILFPTFELEGMDLVPAVPIGIAMFLAVLALPAVAWSAAVAALGGGRTRDVVRAVVPRALLLAVVVGVAVDVSQLLIDPVRRIDNDLVHVLFGVAFTLGLPAFLAPVCARAWSALPVSPPDGTTGRIAVTTAVGAALGAVAAHRLGWVVGRGSGPDMIAAMYVVLVTGPLAGGLTFGHALGVATRDHEPAVIPAT